MSIKKMLLAAGTALAAIAFMAPAAQADVTLTDPKNTALEQNAKITATSTNLVTTGLDLTKKELLGELKCGLVTVHLKVINPGPIKVVLQQEGKITTENCETGKGAPVTITEASVANLTIDTWGTGESEEVTFGADIFKDAEHKEIAAECHLVSGHTLVNEAHEVIGSEATPLHVEATHETDTVHVNGTLIGSGLGCAPQNNIHGEVTLETSDGTPVFVDFATTP